jgi:hypothetical protein
MALADRIVFWAKSQFGRRVGDGNCRTFVIRALELNGAVVPELSPASSGKEAWGDRVHLAQARPGDVVAFHRYRWTRTFATLNWDRGRAEPGPTEKHVVERNNHVAIVLRPVTPSVFEVLEQGVGGDRDMVRVTTVVVVPEPETVARERSFRRGAPFQRGVLSIVDKSKTDVVTGVIRVFRPFSAPIAEILPDDANTDDEAGQTDAPVVEPVLTADGGAVSTVDDQVRQLARPSVRARSSSQRKQ